MTPEEVLESLVEECHEDHVGLWEIVNAVRFDLVSKDTAETRALTLRLVRSLLNEHGMQVGHPAPDGRQGQTAAGICVREKSVDSAPGLASNVRGRHPRGGSLACRAG